MRKTCRKCRAPLNDVCQGCLTIEATKIIGMDSPLAVRLAVSREYMAEFVMHVINMLNDAENYSETLIYRGEEEPSTSVKIDIDSRYIEGQPWPERYVLIVQRAGKVTPHEARRLAEKERDEWKARAEAAEAELYPVLRMHGEADGWPA